MSMCCKVNYRGGGGWMVNRLRLRLERGFCIMVGNGVCPSIAPGPDSDPRVALGKINKGDEQSRGGL